MLMQNMAQNLELKCILGRKNTLNWVKFNTEQYGSYTLKYN